MAFVTDHREIADYVRRHNEGLRAAQERYERERQSREAIVLIQKPDNFF